MTAPRYLTKSRFKLARECPTKLFYTKKKEYPDTTLNDSFLREWILVKVPVDEYIDIIFQDGRFLAQIERFADHYEKDVKIFPSIGSKCGGCEFNCSKEDEAEGYKSGFRECWKQYLNWEDRDFDEPNVLEIWSERRKDQLIAAGKIKFSDLTKDDFVPEGDGRTGLSAKERRWLQVEKVQQNDLTPYFDHIGLSLEMESWIYPLHFIDFETSMVAIPFIRDADRMKLSPSSSPIIWYTRMARLSIVENI